MSADAIWFKSSHSNGDGGACLEVSPSFPAVVPVRDSKLADSPTLLFRRAEWASLIAAVKPESPR
ncbi:hypothetical protein GCM10023205_35010 [Yinghuangia aomiensis]|uniref:DUF397 domain-containing protein n=1 Tax=Yinghuangia aomiensis TaxID=676205 RepID=A0ABP9HCH9_9ACTN